MQIERERSKLGSTKMVQYSVHLTEAVSEQPEANPMDGAAPALQPQPVPWDPARGNLRTWHYLLSHLGVWEVKAT